MSLVAAGEIGLWEIRSSSLNNHFMVAFQEDKSINRRTEEGTEAKRTYRILFLITANLQNLANVSCFVIHSILSLIL